MEEAPKRKSLSLVRKAPSEPLYTIGSFDIGIKNLSFCIIDKIEEYPGFRIRKWSLISLVSQKGKKRLKCQTVLKPRKKNDTQKKKCNKNASFWNNDDDKPIGYCRTHMPKSETMTRYTTTKNITDFELNRMIIESIEQNPELWMECDEVVFEMQKRKNMNRVVYMIFSILSYKSATVPEAKLRNVKVISACHKLSIPDSILPDDIILPETTKSGKNKKTYEGRKILAKEHCEILIKHDEKHSSYFHEQKKKDDLADSFLQGLAYTLLFPKK